MPRQLNRRDFLRSGIVAVGAAVIGPSIWRAAMAEPAQHGPGPYGPLQEPDLNGIMLPEGFTSRVVARAGLPVGLTGYVWHAFPDGGATYPTDDGGWIYVSNSEVPPPVGPTYEATIGGASAIRFAPDGAIVDAYRILDGTAANCAGGPTPWGTWLSCEEHDRGRTWECDPFGRQPAVPLDAMGVFKHEAAAVDPVHGRVYLTEDQSTGKFYRFTPSAYPDLTEGLLECAEIDVAGTVADGGRSGVRWHEVPDPLFTGTLATRLQVPEATTFDGGEGTWYDAGIVYFTTKGDNRVWAYRTSDDTIELLYDDRFVEGDPVLTGVDNIYGSTASGDLFVAEDGGDLDVVIITPERKVSRLLKLTGPAHTRSEICGPALHLDAADPSASRFYFSSQRGFGAGVTYEITGPFRTSS